MKRNVLEYLEQSASKFPDKIAFEDEISSCTFREIEQRAKKIGSVLATKTSVREPIPIFMEKSVNAMAAFLGTVYSGCFYVLLDTKQPMLRLEQILNTLETQRVLTDCLHKSELEKKGFQGEILCLEELEQEASDLEILDTIRSQATDMDPLYGIFTSGSTGIPKGVVVGHRSVIDFIDCFTELFHITDEDVIGNQAPFDFDVSVKDIYSTLKTGATMSIIPKKLFSFPTQLIDHLCEKKVTTLTWAVSALCMITTLKGFEYKVPKTVKKVLFSGEVMPMKHLNQWRQYLPDATFVNLYGPTEITCNCTYYVVEGSYESGDILPIGIPFPNEKVFLLDDKNKLVEEAKVQGEICVSGTALSLGYYNCPEQTAKAFVQNPLNTKYAERIYRTGDLAYYNEEHQLCFVGRKDSQIKHMGHRIELTEIESAIEKVDEIVRVCCIFDETKNKIVAFYEGDIEKRQIVNELRMQLPAFMIPNVFRKMDAIPITKNGKMDRTVLKRMCLEEL